MRLYREGYAEATYRVRLEPGVTTALAAELWLRTPRVQRIRPTFPGAVIEQAGFLADGRVALLVALPAGEERQLWVVGDGGALHRLGPPAARGSLASAPDGQRIAYLTPGEAAPGTEGRLSDIWIAGSTGDPWVKRYALPTTAGGERLIDLSWAADGQHLLVVSQQTVAAGGVRTRFRFLDIGGGEPQGKRQDSGQDLAVGEFLW